MRKIDVSWVDDKLKRISAQLIEAHRAGNDEVISFYARQAAIGVSGHSKRMFMRVIQVFHPDRSSVFMKKLAEIEAKADETAFAEIEKLLQVAIFDARSSPRTSRARPAQKGPSHGGRSGGSEKSSASDRAREAFDGDFEEEYGYDEEDFDDTSYADENTSAYERDDYDETDDDEFFEGGFLDALKRELFGNLEIYPNKAEIEQLEGELDLSDYDISDLSGAEYCRNVINMNLSANNIDNIWALRGLNGLEFLDLSSNDLEDADELAGLANLKEIDLSFNDIDDFAFLEKIPQLSVVSVIGNPIKDPSVLERLRDRGVLVIT